MKKVILQIAVLFLVTPAFGFIKTGEKNVPSTSQALQKAKREGLGLARGEQRIKEELQVLKQKNPTAFKEKVFQEEASNPADYQSYLYEVLAGKSEVEKAKVMAQLEVLNVVRQEWRILKTTILNEFGYDDFESFKPVLMERLASIRFSPTKKSSSIDTTDFRFKVEDWAQVVISKDFKKVNWKLTVNAANDANKLEPGAEKIRILGKDSPRGNGKGGGTDTGFDQNFGGDFDDAGAEGEDDPPLLY